MLAIRLVLAACFSFTCPLFGAAKQVSPPVGSLAVIEDPDGFVNLRSKPDANSEVVLKIQKDEFFVCEPSESEWWRVKDFFDNKGYMHRSRIRLVKDLPGKTLERLFVNPPVADAEDELVDIHKVSEQHLSSHLLHPVTHGGSLGFDGTLFRNTKLNQCIFVTHHTDGMIPLMVLFSSINTPDGVFDELQINTRDGEFASLDAKKANWSDLLAEAATIPSRHFETIGGLRLGEKVDKAIKIFGNPHNVRTSGNTKVYEWGFPGGLYYGWEYSESSLGFLDMDRLTEDNKSINRLSLDPSQHKKIEEHMQNSKFEESLRAYVLPKTRGSRVNLGLGYRVRLYVRDGKIIALAYEWGFE